jgi:hypothetical protein
VHLSPNWSRSDSAEDLDRATFALTEVGGPVLRPGTHGRERSTLTALCCHYQLTEEVTMSTTNVSANNSTDGTPTYLGRGDPAGRFTDYYPAWLNNLADDVTVEGSLLDGAVRGAEAVPDHHRRHPHPV